ncbi:hypothetical protein [Ulvibacter antarcticus]|uniref:DUF3137 domain-containing protein n=1 Tax=Ulvibacter antarcticus TaxID=442714 RepID=A0A3L9YUU7_9FLAO|nr:hypothetical protein [Ulvibacter antarcticus]RMA64293.1 hypothetical protein BXY75_1166 [Ulvibacter antarcticus]
MFEHTLQRDEKALSKNKQLAGKRPSEYWLVFLKQRFLSVKSRRFNWRHFLIAVPFILAIGLAITLATDLPEDDVFPIFIGAMVVSMILSIFLVVIMDLMLPKAFVPYNAFDHLAKFIIYIKGDTYRNIVNIRLTNAVIQKPKNLMSIADLGLQNRKGLKYKAHQLERFKANFNLKDGSICQILMHQLCISVISTKRRSSGKTKTKTKYKHKHYYMLMLKVNAGRFRVMDASELSGLNDRFLVSVISEGDYYLLKIKEKNKLTTMEKEITEQQKLLPSIFTEMIEYLWDKRIIESIASEKLTG